MAVPRWSHTDNLSVGDNMSGVIDKSGRQWEKCNKCGKFVLIERLYYILPTKDNPYGIDMCLNCLIETGNVIKEEKDGQTLLTLDLNKVHPSQDLIEFQSTLSMKRATGITHI
jgi:hypothetical protein